eukprot:720172-Amorphochlora_amoeboformis.AAC.1
MAVQRRRICARQGWCECSAFCRAFARPSMLRISTQNRSLLGIGNFLKRLERSKLEWSIWGRRRPGHRAGCVAVSRKAVHPWISVRDMHIFNTGYGF